MRCGERHENTLIFNISKGHAVQSSTSHPPHTMSDGVGQGWGQRVSVCIEKLFSTSDNQTAPGPRRSPQTNFYEHGHGTEQSEYKDVHQQDFQRAR
jgi:hypothetical protein